MKDYGVMVLRVTLGVIYVVQAYLALFVATPQGMAGFLASKAGLRTVTEAFADRGYTPEGTLVPRSRPGALLHDPQHVARRMIRMMTTGQVEASDGTDVTIQADSICVHGDSPGAVDMAVAVRQALATAGVDIRAFAS